MATLPLKLLPGDHAPWFQAPALGGNPNYAFNTVAGRYILLLFYGSAQISSAREALEEVGRNRALFDDVNACFFGVTLDSEDAAAGRIAQDLPGIRYLLDYDRAVSTLYGLADDTAFRPLAMVLDRSLQILRLFRIEDTAEAIAYLRSQLEAPPRDLWAPVLLVPNVFEPEMCRRLIDLYENRGGQESGFMRDINGKTVGLLDAGMKRRKDCVIEDEELKRQLVNRMHRRLVPPIMRAFQYEPTRIERYIVACYAAAGHFRPHRDNTTKGTAHRKFAVTINLNAGDYEGGDLRFPEYGCRSYRAPTGGAVVFSCSLLHEALPVTRGTRYAFLPFLYDDEAARLREENSRFLATHAPAENEKVEA